MRARCGGCASYKDHHQNFNEVFQSIGFSISVAVKYTLVAIEGTTWTCFVWMFRRRHTSSDGYGTPIAIQMASLVVLWGFSLPATVWTQTRNKHHNGANTCFLNTIYVQIIGREARFIRALTTCGCRGLATRQNCNTCLPSWSVFNIYSEICSRILIRAEPVDCFFFTPSTPQNAR